MSPDTLYGVVVTPKGKGVDPITEPGGFTVKPPEITGGPYHGEPGATITVTGNFFGTKKGKVYIGTTSCKVVNWNMDPIIGASAVTFVVSTKLANGPTSLRVTNQMGSVTANFTVD
jgi:hypothetical protein